MLKNPSLSGSGFFLVGPFLFFSYRKRMGDGSLIILTSEMLKQGIKSFKKKKIMVPNNNNTTASF